MMHTLIPPSYQEAMVNLLRIVIQYGELKRVHDLYVSPILRAKQGAQHYQTRELIKIHTELAETHRTGHSNSSEASVSSNAQRC